MTQAIAVRQGITRADRRALDRAAALDLVKAAGGGARDILITALSNPFMSIILANALVEYLQTVKIPTDEMELVAVPDPTYPGMGSHQWRRKYRPLISQAHATAIESIINTSAALGAFGVDLGAILAAVLKKK